MSATDTDAAMAAGLPFPKIEMIFPLDGFRVRVKWKGSQPFETDLAPVIESFKVYAPLRHDRALLESVHVVNPSVIAWGADDEIDMHVSQIDRLAGERMTSVDFKTFLEEVGLTWDGAAAELGISRRTVGNYARSGEVPRYIALACASIKSRRAKAASLRRG